MKKIIVNRNTDELTIKELISKIDSHNDFSSSIIIALSGYCFYKLAVHHKMPHGSSFKYMWVTLNSILYIFNETFESIPGAISYMIEKQKAEVFLFESFDEFIKEKDNI